MLIYLARETHTRELEGQPPVQYEHEVVTGDGEVAIHSYRPLGDHCERSKLGGAGGGHRGPIVSGARLNTPRV